MSAVSKESSRKDEIVILKFGWFGKPITLPLPGFDRRQGPLDALGHLANRRVAGNGLAVHEVL